VSPRAILNAVVKRKIPSPRRESNPRTQIVLFKQYLILTEGLIFNTPVLYVILGTNV